MTDLMAEAMPTAPIPANEVERLAALYRYHILDTPPEAAFDRITTLAARLFDIPIALVSLVDKSRAWFKSCHGFNLSEVPRDATICSFALLYEQVLVVPDTRQDERFACNPFVQSEPGVRFYAGAPLVTHDGFNLGTLCLLDSKPRDALSAEQQTILADLAAMVVDELELRYSAHRITQIDKALLAVTQGVSAATGEAFFYSLVQHFANVLAVDYAYIGLLGDRDSEELIQTIATCAQGQIVDNFEYLLRDTPCQAVLKHRKICCYPQRVQALFPHAPLLAPLQIESYIAVPFFDSTGTPLGLLGVMDRKPLENAQLTETLLSLFSLRISAELERQWAEEKRIQMLAREQEARQQAEAANRIKDEFLAVLSHELRSPLNPILGWSKLLRNGKLNAAKTAQALEIIERNAQLQSQLIEDLLDVSRILQGKLSLNMAPVNLASTIKAALETVRLAAEAKSIQIQTVFDQTIGQVLGDTARLQQVVWNLLTNAVKFTPEGGRVEILLQPIGSQAQIQVRDTGKGISPDFLPHVFEYFRQADATTTRTFGGLGLGLAIVRHLVELHGGTVQVDSPGEGQGAIFTVKLPLIKDKSGRHKAEGNSSPLAPESSPLTGIRVLVVDDDTDSREFIAFVLEQLGAQVNTVTSAGEAIASLEQSQPNILLSDIGMPNMDGYMLMRQIRAMPPEQGGQILAIALTAYAGEIDRQQALEAGFQHHLAKPLEPNELVKVILNLL
ncbi:response regulator [Microcoleus sp. FACHB-SPT15]|nr:ATP-binding protein [Microcoleus sp. FACHB-SPT15]MBD1808607.1 response regulator [Microcoleus sp. FACHB-SPT15]